jgi:hypothetical protein
MIRFFAGEGEGEGEGAGAVIDAKYTRNFNIK